MTKTKKATEFRPNDFVVYPAHGVGRIISIDEQEVAGLRLEMFVISFEKDKMTLRVPIAKASSVGMRALSSLDIVERALDTLKGRARVKRAMWSRRAQEYEQKINSGDLISIAEVVRDLHRNDDQREQSYPEAIPAAIRLRIHVQAGRPVVVEQAVQLARQSDAQPGQPLEIHRRRHQQQRINRSTIRQRRVLNRTSRRNAVRGGFPYG